MTSVWSMYNLIYGTDEWGGFYCYVARGGTGTYPHISISITRDPLISGAETDDFPGGGIFHRPPGENNEWESLGGGADWLSWKIN